MLTYSNLICVCLQIHHFTCIKIVSSILGIFCALLYSDLELLLSRTFFVCRITPAADTETCPAPRSLTRLSREEVSMAARHSAAAAAALGIGLALATAPASAALLTYR